MLNSDGPECGSEWHGSDRGTHSGWGCAVIVACVIGFFGGVIYLLVW